MTRLKMLSPPPPPLDDADDDIGCDSYDGTTASTPGTQWTMSGLEERTRSQLWLLRSLDSTKNPLLISSDDNAGKSSWLAHRRRLS
eukprot:CAMPEP_0196157172 /NCGR_PEP_ID=MMETSP0910-20130528/43568_1 /TAXON_ID=49265 /ORGANISM="Thalassiosira rotula, Strain GSO102" /LENGTH=85 /DNA_ID=CAMNT_0041421787 /DNA_START=177 /DNA_END=431 /DNA_ORIENTATION=-